MVSIARATQKFLRQVDHDFLVVQDKLTMTSWWSKYHWRGNIFWSSALVSGKLPDFTPLPSKSIKSLYLPLFRSSLVFSAEVPVKALPVCTFTFTWLSFLSVNELEVLFSSNISVIVFQSLGTNPEIDKSFCFTTDKKEGHWRDVTYPRSHSRPPGEAAFEPGWENSCHYSRLQTSKNSGRPLPSAHFFGVKSLGRLEGMRWNTGLISKTVNNRWTMRNSEEFEREKYVWKKKINQMNKFPKPL